MQAIVVTFDRLANTALGCYGNEWIETPHFDRLASQAVVFDRHFAEHVGVSVGMGLGTGRLPRDASERPYEFAAAWSQLTGLAEIELDLLTEFDSVPWSMVLKKTSSTLIAARHEPDPQPDGIPFACLVQAAGKLLAAPRGEASRIVWLHSAGVPEPWLPPEGFATLYFDEYEERGCNMASVTRDNWGTHPAAYAGYVSLFDHWLGELLTAVEAAAKTEPTLLIVTAARGGDWMTLSAEQARQSVIEGTSSSSPLSTALKSPPPAEVVEQRGRTIEPDLPRESLPLSDTITRTPLLLRLFDQGPFDSEFAGTRSNRLVQTADLSATLLDYFQLPVTPSLIEGRSLLHELAETQPPREMICITDGGGWRGIRTAEWSCLVNDAVAANEAESAVKLFAKPEDIWEVNDLSGQQREVVASLVAWLNEVLPVATA
jgi:arylsulfatase A-like enzyme